MKVTDKFLQYTGIVNLLLSSILAFSFLAEANINYLTLVIVFLIGVFSSWQGMSKKLGIAVTVIILIHALLWYPSIRSMQLISSGVISTLTLTFICCLLLSSKKIPQWIGILISSSIFALGLLEYIYYKRFNTGFDASAIAAFMQSDIAESSDFILSSFGIWYLALYGGLIILSIFCLKIISNYIFVPEKVNWVSLLIILPAIYFSPQLHQATIGYIAYHEELSLWKKSLQDRKIQEVHADQSIHGSKDSFIIVIGESASRRHHSLYGYETKTTPYIEKEKDLIIFEDMVSTHSHTVPSLTKMLTAQTINDPQNVPFPSILETANAAGFHTIWLSNQRKMGVWDSKISILSEAAEKSIFVNHLIGKGSKTPLLDDELIKKLSLVLKENKEQKLIVVHLSGSHSPYRSRYPEDFNLLKNHNPLINLYNNSILYTDYILAEFIKLAREHNVAGVMYISDHGEDPANKLGHNASTMTKSMVEVPFWLWTSQNYQLTNSDRIQALQEISSSPLLGDSFFEIAQFILGIEYAGQVRTNLNELVYQEGTRRTKNGEKLYSKLPD